MMCVVGVIFNMPLVQITYEWILLGEGWSLAERQLYFQEWITLLISLQETIYCKGTPLLCIFRDASVGQIEPYLPFSIVSFTEHCRTLSGEWDLLDSE